MKSRVYREPLAADAAYLRERTERKSLFRLFMNWANKQERNRFGWVGFMLVSHGCLITPLTLFAIVKNGNFFPFWIITMFSMGAVLVVNLAGLVPKYTIPVYIISLLVNITMVLLAFTGGAF